MKIEPDNITTSVYESVHVKYKKMADETITLQIFNIIEQNPRISHRKITLQTGLTAGLVHSFMKRVINKGWVRAKQVNAKRWLYFMTPDGFMEKGRLTMGYLSRTLNTYKSAKKLVEAQLEKCYQNNWIRLAVGGDNELAEITALNILASRNLTLVAVVSEKNIQEKIAGEVPLPYSAIDSLDFHKLLVCDPSFMSWNMKNANSLKEFKVLSMQASNIDYG